MSEKDKEFYEWLLSGYAKLSLASETLLETEDIDSAIAFGHKAITMKRVIEQFKQINGIN